MSQHNSVTISSTQIRRDCYKVLRSDKELFIFSGVFLLLISLLRLAIIGSLLLMLFNFIMQKPSVLPEWSAVSGWSFAIYYLLIIIFGLFSLFLYVVYYASVIITINERIKGNDPHFLSTIGMIWKKKRKILVILNYTFTPTLQDFASFRTGRRFIVHEVLLTELKLTEIIKRGQEYSKSNWWVETRSDTKLYLPYVIIFLVVFVLPGAVGKFVSFDLLLKQNPEVFVFLFVGYIILVVLAIFIFWIVNNLISQVYTTLIYNYFIENKHTFGDGQGFALFVRNLHTRKTKQLT